MAHRFSGLSKNCLLDLNAKADSGWKQGVDVLGELLQETIMRGISPRIRLRSTTNAEFNLDLQFDEAYEARRARHEQDEFLAWLSDRGTIIARMLRVLPIAAAKLRRHISSISCEYVADRMPKAGIHTRKRNIDIPHDSLLYRFLQLSVPSVARCPPSACTAAVRAAASSSNFAAKPSIRVNHLRLLFLQSVDSFLVRRLGFDRNGGSTRAAASLNRLKSATHLAASPSARLKRPFHRP